MPAGLHDYQKLLDAQVEMLPLSRQPLDHAIEHLGLGRRLQRDVLDDRRSQRVRGLYWYGWHARIGKRDSRPLRPGSQLVDP